jgi:hypothetical protein
MPCWLSSASAISQNTLWYHTRAHGFTYVRFTHADLISCHCFFGVQLQAGAEGGAGAEAGDVVGVEGCMCCGKGHSLQHQLWWLACLLGDGTQKGGAAQPSGLGMRWQLQDVVVNWFMTWDLTLDLVLPLEEQFGSWANG